MQRRSKILIFTSLIVLSLPLGFKAALLGLPRLKGIDAPALFPFHAAWVLRSNLGFPLEVQASVPPPAKGSPAYFQLKGMGLWENTWTPKALEQGLPDPAGGRACRLRLGKIELERIRNVSPLLAGNTCQVEAEFRWTPPSESWSLLNLKSMIGLKIPGGLGETEARKPFMRSVILKREGLQWKVKDLDKLSRHLPGQGRPLPWLAWAL